MGSLFTSLTGTGGNSNTAAAGSNFIAAGNPNVVNGTNAQQVSDAYNSAQTGLSQQQSFLNAVNAQNGLANQSSVYNQLQGVANGTGANPAQAMLAQSTGQNVSNQAALMAGQRGSGANVGLMARQAAQQGAATQQQAAGQAATLQANQSLNALSQMGTLATSQANQAANATNAYSNSAQAEQSSLLNAQNGYNTTAAGMTNNQNSTNGTIANTVATGQQNMFSGLTSGLGSAVTSLLAGGGEVGADGAKMMATGGSTGTPLVQSVGGSSGPQSFAARFMTGASTPATTQQSTAQNMAGAGSSIAGVVGAGLKSLFGNGTAQTPGVDPNSDQAYNTGAFNNGSDQALNTMTGTTSAGGTGLLGDGAIDSSASAATPGMDITGLEGNMFKAANGGQSPGKVKAMLSPGEKYLSPKAVAQVEKGADPMKVGKTVPGKAPVKGAVNSYDNDVVPATLEKGGVVVPRSVTQSKNPSEKSIAFVHAIAAKHGMKVMPAKGGKK